MDSGRVLPLGGLPWLPYSYPNSRPRSLPSELVQSISAFVFYFLLCLCFGQHGVCGHGGMGNKNYRRGAARA
ncbi:hypothetical protein M431DRAFT_318009 [Trichoderma harzianum CBS 226.95]|uniref:Uncharacterized protein n=1 Tax=Trichoderma harzianum CBS 226.95 TaxID=983964 RepID=A0A2T3ZWQ3_TRIHA|nr:hypothetical protein M431DRAFT_318009 [Trichoderma harzianum CBS 226.95]PTB49163.1 hypothetical protein M431DRAFT_318009 [Trichoderma harzianum CBS 226.95]